MQDPYERFNCARGEMENQSSPRSLIEPISNGKSAIAEEMYRTVCGQAPLKQPKNPQINGETMRFDSVPWTYRPRVKIALSRSLIPVMRQTSTFESVTVRTTVRNLDCG